jgi:hypothetical protein
VVHQACLGPSPNLGHLRATDRVQGPLNAQCDRPSGRELAEDSAHPGPPSHFPEQSLTASLPERLFEHLHQGRRARASTPTYGMASFRAQCLMGWCPSAPTKACGAATVCEWKTGGLK